MLTRTSLHVLALTYESRDDVLSRLLDAVDRAGGWVLERQATSAQSQTLWIEMQSRVLIEMYAAVTGSDIHLTRESHRALAEWCNCLQQLRRASSLSAMLTLRLEITFLTDSTRQTEWVRSLSRSLAAA